MCLRAETFFFYWRHGRLHLNERPGALVGRLLRRRPYHGRMELGQLLHSAASSFATQRKTIIPSEGFAYSLIYQMKCYRPSVMPMAPLSGGTSTLPAPLTLMKGT